MGKVASGLFIVGAERSGTTLLSVLLDRHSRSIGGEIGHAQPVVARGEARIQIHRSLQRSNPSFLRSTAGGEATQYRDWGIPLGRRFRALKLWYQLRIDGPDSIRGRLRRDLDNAQWFKGQIEARDEWDVVAPVRLQTVCVRHTPAALADDPEAVSAHNQAWVKSINTSGEAFLSPALLDDVWMARVSVGVESTERRHLERLLDLMDHHAG